MSAISDDQIEAAARALYAEDDHELGWLELHPGWREKLRREARRGLMLSELADDVVPRREPSGAERPPENTVAPASPESSDKTEGEGEAS
jgi:hypothetical protein